MGGVRQPGPQSTKLFYLHRDGRVLGDGWEGFRIVGDALVTPAGYSFKASQLQLFGLLYQHALAVQSEHRDAKLGKLLEEFQHA